MSKTNLDILDQDSWNYVKNMKNKYGFRSVADYIFKIIDLSKSMNLDRWQFLIAIEKFYEYSFYDIDDLSFELGISAHNVRKLIRKYLGDKTPVYDISKTQREKIIRKIHELMIKSRILPRELSIAYNLKDFINQNKIKISNYQEINKEFELKNIRFDNRMILKVLFPDDLERRNEIYSETIEMAESLIKLDKFNDFDLDPLYIATYLNPGDSFEIEDSFGFHANAGTEFLFGQDRNFGVNIDVKYIWNEADLNKYFVAAPPESYEIDLDALVVGLGFKYYF